jgi:type IV secretory pathway ATPase VirB11/archaellum biosynthesis ATPase
MDTESLDVTVAKQAIAALRSRSQFIILDEERGSVFLDFFYLFFYLGLELYTW